MAGIMKINYLIDPKVRGTVNIHTAGQLNSNDVFPIFQSILKLNGATAIRKENLVEIVPFPDAKKLYTTPSATRDPGKAPAEERFTIQIIRLNYIPVTEVSKLVKPFLSDGADIIEHPPNNIIIIGDVTSNVRKCLDIIDLFDIDIFVDLRVRIYPIANGDVTDVAKEMERIFASFEVSTKSGRGIGITFTPIARINSLLVVSSIPNIFEKVEGWLKELDKIPTEGSKYSVFVYYCQNAKAKDLADVLKGVFTGAKDKKEEFKAKVTEPATRPGVRQVPTPGAPAPATPAKEDTAVVPEGEINIVVDESNNALVIRAFQRDYKNILETVKKLDIYPRQVLLEVLLADISLNDDLQYGLEFSRFLSSNPPNAQGVFINATPPSPPSDATDGSKTGALVQTLAGTVPGGIRYTIVEMGQRLIASVRAAAAEGLVKVVSSPNILASNNKEAKIQVGSSEPIPTGVYTSTTATVGTSGIVETSVEYKDIGTIVTVTPRISDGGLVTMEINVEDSALGPIQQVGNLQNVRSFIKRTAKTVVSIVEGQTLVMGGLIRDEKTRSTTGVPFLTKIPLIGWLFGNKTRLDRKTELVLLLTPHVITDQAQSNAVTKEFKDKIIGLREEIEKREKK
jgi:general secretion pathway protein D